MIFLLRGVRWPGLRLRVGGLAAAVFVAAEPEIQDFLARTGRLGQIHGNIVPG